MSKQPTATAGLPAATTDAAVPAAGKPVVRFAPSPTGYLHIGGARTALFNWLYARHTGGTFVLRIEDTDRERNNPDAVAAILDGLTWLQLDWTGDAVSQFERAGRHAEVAHAMLASGHAYHCYASKEETEAAREAAKAEGRPQLYLSPWRDRDPKDAPAGVRPTIRLKAPREGETAIDDKVQGHVVFQNKEFDDLIILRSDGSPTYNLAVVVDDHDMAVTHVIRGVDHLTNAGRQTQIYNAMGWTVPVWAHVPLIHGADGAKLSKRHGALGAEAYRAMGFLPIALRNYLVRLGWSHGDAEIISTDQLIAWFGFDGLGRSPARFDFKKLLDLNGHYIREADNDELLGRIADLLPGLDFKTMAATELDPKAPPRPDVEFAKRIIADGIGTGLDLKARFEAVGWNKFARALPALKERSKTLLDFVDGALFLIALRPLKLDDKAAKVLTADAKASNCEVAAELSKVSADAWTAASLEAAVKLYVETSNLQLGKVAQPLRAALTGRTVSPPVFDVLAVLGREESLARLND